LPSKTKTLPRNQEPISTSFGKPYRYRNSLPNCDTSKPVPGNREQLRNRNVIETKIQQAWAARTSEKHTLIDEIHTQRRTRSTRYESFELRTRRTEREAGGKQQKEADDDMGSVRGTIKIESLRSFGRSKKSTKEKQVRTWQNRANENKRNPPPLVDAREEEGRRRASAAKRLSVERRKSGCGRLIMLRAG
jgi:hypothetical protein